MAEIILPGTYITVRDEGLITAGRVATGNIGIVGTASKGPIEEVKTLSSFAEAKEIFGENDPWKDGTSNELTLIRMLEYIFSNGGRAVYAVRVASENKEKAAYQTINDDGPLTKLKARTFGTWGNRLMIKIEPATSPALIQEELTGNATGLSRKKIQGSNASIQLRKSNGNVLVYEVVYNNVSINNSKAQVKIDTNTGALTFTTLNGYVPAPGDTILARYFIRFEDSKKVTLNYGPLEESYIIADASHLAQQVNKNSYLVYTDSGDENDHKNELPTDTNGQELFGTGLNGHTPGNDGANADASAYKKGLEELENEIINIVLLAGQDASDEAMLGALQGHLNITAQQDRERIGIIGSNDSKDEDDIANHTLNSDRMIFVAPGIRVSNLEMLPGAYTASAVAGLISSLPVQASPTNKTLNIPGLSVEFTRPKLEKLVQNRVLAIEKREGYRVVKGITTATNSAWHQITTRRIVDYAKYGVRSACNPYIGKLNNDRVRGAMKATLDAFLTRMVEDEALVSYELEVSATRAQEIAGEAIVTLVLRPTFSIDFIKVTMYLE